MGDQAELESLKERLALLEKQVSDKTPDAPDERFHPAVLDSKKLAKDAQSGGLYVPRHQENPYSVGREPGQKTNPMVMVPGRLSQPVACGPAADAGVLQQPPGVWVPLGGDSCVLLDGELPL